MNLKMFKCICGRDFKTHGALVKHGRTLCKLYQIEEHRKAVEWALTVHTCENCKKPILKYYGTGRFCSEFCARAHSGKSAGGNTRRVNCTKCGQFYIIYKRVGTKKFVCNNCKSPVYDKIKSARVYIHPNLCKLGKLCASCGDPIKDKNKSGFCGECIKHAPELKDLRIQLGKHAASFVKNHTGWASRNMVSYAEQFWRTVLSNNNIEYEPEYPVRIGKEHHYFLDFYMQKYDKNIDLEIDGKQHTYEDRAASDKIRDELLTKQGYIVYRIPWNEINSEKGKAQMKEKIDNFLNWYNNL